MLHHLPVNLTIPSAEFPTSTGWRRSLLDCLTNSQALEMFG